MSKLWTQIPSSFSAKQSRSLDSIIQHSRLAAVSKPIPSYRNAESKQERAHPTHQVITTTPASRLRQNWGLKNTLPKKQHVPYVVLDHLDHNGLTGFDSGSRFPMVLNRVRELRKHVNHLMSPRKDGSRADAFFNSILETTISQHRMPGSKNISANEMRTIQNNEVTQKLTDLGYNKKFISKVISQKVLADNLSTENGYKFLEKFAKSQLGQSQLTGNDEAGQVDTFLYKRPIATAGASYLLKGSLNNRPSLAPTPYTESKSEDTLTSLNNELPSATTQYPIVPGRVLNGGVAVAGLVSTSNMVVNSRQSAPKPEMDKMQPFTVKNINIRNDGSLEMSVETYNSRLNRRKGTQPTARDLMQNTIKQSLSNNNLSRSRSQIPN